MRTPVENLSDAQVGCLRCGTQGVGNCGCARLNEAQRKAQEFAGEVVEVLMTDKRKKVTSHKFGQRYGKKLTEAMVKLDTEERLAYCEGLMQSLHGIFK
ncbi:hypothetical protein F4827_002322 [Paraburkholderia bannensis]|uniref:Uncharacterized protein n=1 Tax=Paraburkholderia bannensis TaxID=765414 RepID=A0A7W9TY50_9BURK|nr:MULTISPECIES: hypothetical protein [Paraburkholderia]MBB3257457.1 hypothetical protein [Paraburkholderia sp. WP4_3_2]MBB6102470.1 hypothetical protein [Paraburkholderia bannensis]